MTADVIIRKQKIKIRTSDQYLALQLRKQLNDLLQYDLISMMEKVFAQADLAGIYIIIDKMNIDLGTVTAKDFEQHFIKLAETKLINELRKQVNEKAEATYTNSKSKDDFHHNTDPLASLQYNSSKQQELNALLHFLHKGIYPWWYKKESQQTPAELLKSLSEEETETLLIKILSKNYSNEERKKIVERLFMHLPQTKNESIVYRLLALYNNTSLTTNTEMLLKNKNDLIQLFSISIKDFYTQLFHFLIYENIESKDNTIYDFIKQLTNEQKASIETLKERIASIAGKDFPFANDLKQMLASDKETTAAENDTTLPNDLIVRKKQTTTTEEEGIYIGNAGLVLLHPFLPAFFSEAGLLTIQNKFISIEAQQKAAVLLYYLQCSNEQYKEWEMALNKIICGIAADELLPDGILITETEKEECKVLLQAVADFWEALKGASGGALQNTFILREGKITWKEEYWLIQIERTGVDILLDRLPWGFNTIKLPWLEHLIYTEW